MKITLEEALQKSKKALKEGRINDAVRIYRAIATVQRHHSVIEKEVRFALKKVREASPTGEFTGQLEKLLAELSLEKNEHHKLNVPATPVATSPPEREVKKIVDLYQKGQLLDALNGASELLKNFPNSVALHDLSGVVYSNLGRYEMAAKCFRNVLKMQPESESAHLNMGNALKQSGQNDAALEHYEKAISINPRFAHAHNNIGIIKRERGEINEAMEAFRIAIKWNPSFKQAHINAVESLKGKAFSNSRPEMMDMIDSFFNHPEVIRPKDFAPAAVSLTRLDDSVKELLDNVQVRGSHSIAQKVSTLSKIPFLLKLMAVCPLPDAHIESLLRNIRSELLLDIQENKPSTEILAFQSALALQCFTNEYIYSKTEEEHEALKELESTILEDLDRGLQPQPELILCLASYGPLFKYPWCEMLKNSEIIAEVFQRQLLEPQRENQIKEEIQTLVEPNDEVSVMVQSQYEENPYPRWVTFGLVPDPLPSLETFRRLKLRFSEKVEVNFSSPDILVGGCGTGQHSLQVASRYQNCKVLAIDLSRASLAYAKRKSDELGLKNLEYMQADILNLANISREFDIIECAGVLHHMRDPMEGWRLLVSCLKPGGLMKIGLYSELGRENIRKIIEEIKQSKTSHSAAGMHSFRNSIMNSNKPHHKEILSANDFYSSSALRDLLFHTTEHRFNLNQIKDSLELLNLNFCGFENAQILDAFSREYAEVDALYDLKIWDDFESRNPRIFSGMYQFWCQKLEK